VRRSDEVEAQRRRWTFYETIVLEPFCEFIFLDGFGKRLPPGRDS
jgi:hypothetical protein